MMRRTCDYCTADVQATIQVNDGTPNDACHEHVSTFVDLWYSNQKLPLTVVIRPVEES